MSWLHRTDPIPTAQQQFKVGWNTIRTRGFLPDGLYSVRSADKDAVSFCDAGSSCITDRQVKYAVISLQIDPRHLFRAKRTILSSLFHTRVINTVVQKYMSVVLKSGFSQSLFHSLKFSVPHTQIAKCAHQSQCAHSLNGPVWTLNCPVWTPICPMWSWLTLCDQRTSWVKWPSVVSHLTLYEYRSTLCVHQTSRAVSDSHMCGHWSCDTVTDDSVWQVITMCDLWTACVQYRGCWVCDTTVMITPAYHRWK